MMPLISLITLRRRMPRRQGKTQYTLESFNATSGYERPVLFLEIHYVEMRGLKGESDTSRSIKW